MLLVVPTSRGRKPPVVGFGVQTDREGDLTIPVLLIQGRYTPGVRRARLYQDEHDRRPRTVWVRLERLGTGAHLDTHLEIQR